MIRKLAIALSLLGVCFAGLVHALGLGEVTVKSALNQPLNAEIELVNTAGLTLNEILPGLATREEFQKANVDRVYFLSDLRFEVKPGSKGKAVIVLTSKKPVREPYLNFIVELIWPSGRLLREYALLIDPPLFSEQPVAKVSAPSTANVSRGDVLSVPSQTSSASARSILAPTENVVTGTYGPTTATDTLWEIATKARPNRSVSPQQVMLAIQDLNPDAFIDDNINKLKAGQVLRLPSLEQIKQRSQHQAIIGVIAQNDALYGRKTASVVQGSDTKTPTPSKTATPEQAISTADQLKLVVAENNTNNTSTSANSGQSTKGAGNTSNELALTLEKLDKANIENKELNSRVSDLEEQLSTLQRLLTLKNDQLSSIQTQMRANEFDKLKAEADQAAIAKADPMEASSSVSGQEEMTDSSVPASSNQQVEGLSTSSVVAESVNVSDSEENDVSDESNAEPAAISPPVVDESKIAGFTESVKSSQDLEQKENIIERIINNPLYLGITLISVLIIVIVLWLVSRYNAKREEEFQALHAYDDEEELKFDSSDDLDAKAVHADESLSDELESQEEAELTNGDESEDIIGEVNAYISYGRLDQAAQSLEKAISQDPVRTDYRLKLLSVYKDLGDRSAFDRQYSELQAIQDKSAIKAADKIRSEFEEESLDLDEELALNTTSTDLDESDNKQDQEVDEFEADLKSFDFDSVELNEENEDLTADLDLGDLDLSTDDLSEELTQDADLSDDLLEAEDVLSLDEADLELSETDELLDLDSDNNDADSILSDEDLLAGEDLLAEDNSLSDLGIGNETSEQDDFDDSILDVELEDLDLTTELDQEAEISLTQQTETQELSADDKESDLVVSDDILEEAAQAFEAETALDADLSDADEFDFLKGTDEASTKLDLARAYIDMGDIEGAKDILLEVAKEGNAEQQAEAKDLIDSLD